jgi:poly-gamma-glutamate synthesis protein (capsule biosynthesis protein)
MPRFLQALSLSLACTCCSGAEAVSQREPAADEAPDRRPGSGAARAGEPAVDGAQTAVPFAPEERFTVIAVGDVMMDKHAQSAIARHGLDYPFARAAPVLAAHDVAFANLEAPISSGGAMHARSKRYHFRVDPRHARALTHSGIDVVSLANNHMMDYGETALLDTVTHLSRWSILHAGAGGNLEAARAPARLAAGATEVVVLAYCAWAPAPIHARDDKPGVAPLEGEIVTADVRRYKREDNVVLVSLHWGVQHTDTATPAQRHLAREILDAGADAVLGHHPHRPQEVEVHDGKIVAYSLGNFLFGYYNPIYRNNIALVLEFEGTELAAARILPVDGKNARIRFQPRFLEGRRAGAVLGHVARLSRRLGTVMHRRGHEAVIDLSQTR